MKKFNFGLKETILNLNCSNMHIKNKAAIVNDHKVLLCKIYNFKIIQLLYKLFYS